MGNWHCQWLNWFWLRSLLNRSWIWLRRLNDERRSIRWYSSYYNTNWVNIKFLNNLVLTKWHSQIQRQDSFKCYSWSFRHNSLDNKCTFLLSKRERLGWSKVGRNSWLRHETHTIFWNCIFWIQRTIRIVRRACYINHWWWWNGTSFHYRDLRFWPNSCIFPQHSHWLVWNLLAERSLHRTSRLLFPPWHNVGSIRWVRR